MTRPADRTPYGKLAARLVPRAQYYARERESASGLLDKLRRAEPDALHG